MPWMFQYVRTNGDYRVCCHQVQAKAVVRSEDGSTMNIKTHEVNSFRRSADLCQMRSQFLNSQWPESCLNCRAEEEAGMTSRRQTEVRRWSRALNEEQCRQQTSSGGHLNEPQHPLLGMELRLGNKCNLKCRMCHPRFSSAWYADFVSLWGNNYPEYGKEIEIYRGTDGEWATTNVSYDWPLDRTSWERLLPELDGIRYIYISGGEPLLIEDHFKILERIIQSGRAGEVVIEMASNLTVLPQRALELWPHFKRVGVSASFDGVGSVNDYIRFPSRWETVEKNLRQICDMGNPVEVWIQPCVQALNILSLGKIYEWRMDFHIENTLKAPGKEILNPLILQDPKYLSVQVFPSELKLRIQDLLRAEGDRLTKRAASDAQSIRVAVAYHEFAASLIEFMNKEDHSQDFDRFVDYNCKLDELRGQSLASALPELADLLGRDRKLMVSNGN